MRRELIYKTSILILFLALIACTNGRKPDEIHLRIIETTDVHGAIIPFDFLNGRDIKNSLAQVHTFVDGEKNKNEQEIILLDNGDILQGQPIVYLSNFIDTASVHICAKTMNFMGYDAATVGNHDIEAGHDVYDKLVDEFDFPWMAANAVNTSSGEPYFQPYTVIERKGLRIAVLGLITPGIPQWLPPKLYSGIIFEDMVKSASFWVTEIEKEEPDLIIGLFHAGHDYSYGGHTKSEPGNENGSLLVAENVPGFDIIFIGHDHDTMLDSLTNVAGETVYIVDPGSNARYAGVADIQLIYNRKKGEYSKKVALELVDISEYTPDPGFLEYLDQDYQETRQFVEEKVATLTESIYSREALFGNSAFADIIHRIQLDLTDADLSFTAPLAFNTVIEAGELTIADLFKLYRYENFLYTMNLSGREIRDYLEYSYGQWFNQMEDEYDHLLRLELDENGDVIRRWPSNSGRLSGRYYNFDSAVGINYTVDIGKPVGERINITSMADGSPYDLEHNYRVALNSYRGNGGGGHLTTGSGIADNELVDRITSSSAKDLRFHMMEWMIEKENLEPIKYNNWKVIPHSWWMKGKERDIKILFPTIE